MDTVAIDDDRDSPVGAAWSFENLDAASTTPEPAMTATPLRSDREPSRAASQQRKRSKPTSDASQPPAKRQRTDGPKINKPHSARTSDLIVRTYGDVAEGLSSTISPESPSKQQELCQRWRNRRSLAEYTRYPEGYEFIYSLDGRPDRAVILLTPPNRVAILQQDGTWKRETRNESIHGPAPYTKQWYNQYLTKNCLPSWFMTSVHVAMAEDDSEAVRLNVPGYETFNNALAAKLVEPGYLVARYPGTPHHPTRLLERTRTRLDDETIVCLARRFPAVTQLSAGQDIILNVDGSMFFHHEPKSLADVPFDLLKHIEWFPRSSGPTAYVTNGEQDDSNFLLPQFSKPDDRQKLLEAAMRNGGKVNPVSIPKGEGHWEWLEKKYDEPVAEVLGLGDPQEIIKLYAAGGLRLGMMQYARPTVVWFAKPEYVNPPGQPEGLGRWEFMTENDEKLAQSADFRRRASFPSKTLQVSAHDVWELRAKRMQQMEMALEGDLSDEDFDDPTVDIDLVWVPGDAEATPADVIEIEDDDEEDAVNTAAPPPAPVANNAGYGIDQHTGLAHDPTNGGDNNQTATGSQPPLYQTRMIGGKKITLDRARAKQGSHQSHKLWLYTEGGKWEATKHQVDFNNKADVEELNRWREQSCKRNGWPLKRSEVKPNYTKEERVWMFQRVVAAEGEKPTETWDQLAQAFNDHFQTTGLAIRTGQGVRALYERCMKEYKENDGEMKVRRKAGRPPKVPAVPQKGNQG